MFGLIRKQNNKGNKGYRGKIEYPSGCAVEDGTNTYLIKTKGFYRFGSNRAYQSWYLLAGECLPENIAHLKELGVLGFREGSLLSKYSDGTLHLVSNNKTRHIVDPDALDKYSLLGRYIWVVSDSEFNLHDVGDELSG